MRRVDIARRSGISLKQAKARTILTSLAIAVGATTITLALAAGNGGRAYMNNFIGQNADMNSIQVIRKNISSETEQETGPKKLNDESSKTEAGSGDEAVATDLNKYALNDADKDKISKIKGVKTVREAIYLSPDYVQLESSKDQFESNSMIGQYNETKIPLATGNLAKNNQVEKGTVVVPQEYIKAFAAGEAEKLVGKNIIFGFTNDKNEKFTKKFKISAVDAGKTDELVFYDPLFVVANEDAAEIQSLINTAMDGKNYHSALFVGMNGERQANQIRDDIVALDSERYEVMTFEDQQAMMSQGIDVLQYGLMGFGGLAILASIFGIINTQYISVLERTSQIGLMKALGAKRKDIAKLFRYEAALIGFLGGMIGVGVAYLVSLLNPLITSFLGLKEGTELLQIDIRSTIILVVSLMMVSIMAGYFPSRKAAKLDPIEALRTE